MKTKIFKGIISVFFLLLIIELSLQIAGLIFIKFKYKKNHEIVGSNTLRIMFIGDSWTQGADATPLPGYVPLTIQKLSQIYPDKNIKGFNYAWGSTNSSQAIQQFLDHYWSIKPHILVVMTGANDGWNTQDILIAQRRIKGKIQRYNQKDIKLREYVINIFKKMKLVKSYQIISYNFLYKYKETKHPFFENGYSNMYMRIFSASREKARDYLINNYNEAKYNYNDFFTLILHSFDGDIDRAKEFLESRNMYKPNCIKRFNIEKHRNYITSKFKILKENLNDLKSFCDQEHVIIIMENYPHLIFKELNEILEGIASEGGITYVNHYRYFEENVGYENWNNIMTPGHVNWKGHEYMADNLANVLSKSISDCEIFNK